MSRALPLRSTQSVLGAFFFFCLLTVERHAWFWETLATKLVMNESASVVFLFRYLLYPTKEVLLKRTSLLYRIISSAIFLLRMVTQDRPSFALDCRYNGTQRYC